MIVVYTRPGCGGCEKVKARLNSLELDYREYKVDEDVTKEFIIENFPDKNILPIVVINDVVYAGPIEVGHILSEYGRDVEKELLNEENHEAISRLISEGGPDDDRHV